jgi:hypothetical protein
MVDRFTSADVESTGHGTYRLKTGPSAAAPVGSGFASQKGREADFQSEIERWLTDRGYRRLTPTTMGMAVPDGGVNLRGFFGHWPESRGNAFMPDLLVVPWPNVRPSLFLELKAGAGAGYRPGQKAAIALGLWRVAFDLQEAKRIVEAWEASGAAHRSDLVYLASPYSHPDAGVREHRFREVNRVAVDLVRLGMQIYSPISHSHTMATEGDLPKSWLFWRAHCYAILRACSRVIVLMQDGWEDSVGVQAEIAIAREKGLPVEYMRHDRKEASRG